MNAILNVYKKTLFPVYFSHCAMVLLFVKPQEPPDPTLSNIPNPILQFLTLLGYSQLCHPIPNRMLL